MTYRQGRDEPPAGRGKVRKGGGKEESEEKGEREKKEGREEGEQEGAVIV